MKASSDFSQSLFLYLEATPANYVPRLESNPRSAYNKRMRISGEDFDELNLVWSSDVWDMCIEYNPHSVYWIVIV